MAAADPVTSHGAAGGRPRTKPVPDSPFNSWLGGQKLSVAAIAKSLGLSSSAIYHLRSGHHRPSLDVALKIEQMSDGTVPATSWAVQPIMKPAGGRPRAASKAAAKSESKKRAGRRRTT